MKPGGEQPGREDRGSRAVTEDEGDADTTAQLRAMRSVWLSMRDEDPPDGGLVDLLAAARTKAAAMRARPTLRQRLAAWVRRPPALAFATVVVLVGGAVLVLGRNSGHRASEIAAGSSGVISERAPQAETVVHGQGALASPTTEEPRPEIARVKDDVAPVPPRRVATRPTTTRGAEPIEPTSPADGATGQARLLDDEAAKREEPTQLDRLYAQCSSAARRGDCAAVRTMVGKIAKTDRGYRARVAKDAAVARCLAPLPADAADALAK